MVTTSLLGCIGCWGIPKLLLGVSFYVGCVGMMYYQFGCYTNAMKVIWGIPRFHTTDFFSLSLLLVWPLTYVQFVRDDHTESFVVLATLMLVACFVFLWFRGLWLLQSHDVHGFAKRCCFFGLAIPLVMASGLLWGFGAVITLITFGVGIFGWAIAIAASLPLMLATNSCLLYTFGWTRGSVSSEKQSAANFPTWLQQDAVALKNMDTLSRT